ncbi:MAG: hypothetical protein WC861_06680, partial [Candidatus Micrarchaeia archaeon]
KENAKLTLALSEENYNEALGIIKAHNPPQLNMKQKINIYDAIGAKKQESKQLFASLKTAIIENRVYESKSMSRKLIYIDGDKALHQAERLIHELYSKGYIDKKENAKLTLALSEENYNEALGIIKAHNPPPFDMKQKINKK